MTYLIVQTFILLLIAGVLGMIFGWYLTWSSASAARAALHTRLRKADKDVRELRNELGTLTRAKANCDTDRRVLSDELADLRARLDQQATTAVADTAPGAMSEAPVTGAAPPLLGDEAGDADDLRQIRGIGPKIAGILMELGIRRYEQIAEWTPEHVEWINAHLKFKGRVEREEWIPQARALLADRGS